MPNELSGGMRKRAGFARALVLDPAIVMFDEPDSGLDPVRTALLCELIREVHEENGGCYMVISHDLGTARRIADFIAVLWKGRIVESGPSSELFDSPQRVRRPIPERGDHRPAGDGLGDRGRAPHRRPPVRPAAARNAEEADEELAYLRRGLLPALWCVERPAPVIALAVLLAIVGAIGAARSKPNGEAETLVDKGSDTFAATEEFKEEFGDDAVVSSSQGDLDSSC